MSGSPISVLPATPGRFDDLAGLFGPEGACDGCWCLFPRLPGPEFEAGEGDENRRRLQALVEDGAEPGLLAYLDNVAVGWVSLGPRRDFARLLRSPLFRPDRRGEDPSDPAVWSVVCFFIDPACRRGGLTDELLDAAVRHAASRGATAVEGYPVETERQRADDELFWGTPSVFARAGFEEVAAVSPRRRLMHRRL